MIRNRSMLAQVVLFCVTFGIYSIYWFYAVVCELQEATGDSEASPALWTVLLFVPFANIYSLYKFSELYEKWSPDRFNRWLLFVLWLVFSPAVWFIVQSELNRAAAKIGVAAT
ncbi:MAG TPA: DUF4234 domain-containing protein [Myxococcales bacterium]|nr:DUF4234 domain-containing protein [Myxococcales bacterium]